MKIFAIWFGKISLVLTRVLHIGGGTTFPGLLAEKIDANIISKLSSRIEHGAIVVTGTNGKTTSAKMLVEILSEEGYTVLHNPSGSNLTRGIASALIQSSNIFGTSLKANIAVFEVDEATMPEATTKIRPALVMVTNLFRDQLDRYGELDNTAVIVGSSLRGFPKMTTVLNADDPLVSSLSEYAEGPVMYFGLDDVNIQCKSKAAMDSKDCVKCGQELDYGNRSFGHLGDWSCPNCGLKRPLLNFSANSLSLEPQKSNFNIKLESGELTIQLPVPGLYNVYNALSAASAAEAIGAGGSATVQALRNCAAAFGRMEMIQVDSKNAMMLLVKNPTGANQSLSSVFSDGKPKSIAMILNDNFADGTDISWIWDVDFECFNLKDTKFVASGIRAEDMALRLKYAGIDEKYILVEKDPISAVRKLAANTKEGEICYILPTYTAMVEIRNAFIDKKDRMNNMGKVTKHGI